jgi:hypothetical protein
VARLRPEQARRTADESEYTYTDASVEGEVVYYRVRLVPTNGAAETSSTIKVGRGPKTDAQATARLVSNYPNPFTESTTVAYEVREPTPVTLSVWTVTGTRVETLVDQQQSAGEYEVTFDATSLPSGSYFVRLKTPASTQMRRMTLLR